MSYDWDRFFEVISPALPNFWQTLLVVLGLVVLIWLILRIKAWMREDSTGSDCAIDLIGDLQEMHRQGGLTEEEYRLIKTRLAQAALGKSPSPRTGGVTDKQTMLQTTARAAAATQTTMPQGQPASSNQEPVGPTATDAADPGPGRAPCDSAP